MIEPSTNPTARTEAELRALMARAVHEVRETNPLAPSITNTVTQNFVANAQLAVGGSAAMVYLPDEGECVAALGGAIYINLGTLLPVYEQTVPATARACAATGKPWVLDPVGIGIGSLRTQLIEAVRENPPAILRGNASEIIAVAELWGLGDDAAEDASGDGPRGVDSTDSVDAAERAAVACARFMGGAVAVSGTTDLVTDGAQVAARWGACARSTPAWPIPSWRRSPQRPPTTWPACALPKPATAPAASKSPSSTPSTTSPPRKWPRHLWRLPAHQPRNPRNKRRFL